MNSCTGYSPKTTCAYSSHGKPASAVAVRSKKVEEVLRLLGEAETRAAYAEQGRVDVTCEYCGRLRSFDAVDVTRVFSGQAVSGTDSVH